MVSSLRKLTQDQTKRHNQQLVLQLIYHDHGLSRADIARASGLTPTTVSNLVAELMETGLVEETGLGPSEGGKPPILLAVAPNARQVIGLDLSNSQFQGALLDLRGQVLERIRLPWEGRQGSAAEELALRLADQLVARADSPLLGIGIGAPGLVDVRAGVVRHAPRLGWRDLALATSMEQRYGLPVHLANDSHAAALAEVSFGALPGIRNLVLVKVGHGIGSGIVLDGRLHYGDGFRAGEIGHVVVVDDGEPCRCGNRGCLETVASVQSLERQAGALAVAGTIPELLSGNGSTLWPAICQAAAEKPELRALLEQAGRHLGRSLAQVASFLDVEHIVVAGQIVQAGPVLLESVQAEMRRCMLPAMADDTVVRYATLGDDIVLMGASALVLSGELGLA